MRLRKEARPRKTKYSVSSTLPMQSDAGDVQRKTKSTDAQALGFDHATGFTTGRWLSL